MARKEGFFSATREREKEEGKRGKRERKEKKRGEKRKREKERGKERKKERKKEGKRENTSGSTVKVSSSSKFRTSKCKILCFVIFSSSIVMV